MVAYRVYCMIFCRPPSSFCQFVELRDDRR